MKSGPIKMNWKLISEWYLMIMPAASPATSAPFHRCSLPNTRTRRQLLTQAGMFIASRTVGGAVAAVIESPGASMMVDILLIGIRPTEMRAGSII
jgi:hypothetical protein